MTTVGLIPSQVLVSLSKDQYGAWIGVPDGQSVVPLVKIAKPAFDPNAQTVDPNTVWFSDRVERQWTIRSLTQSELDAKAETEADVTRKQQARNALTILDNGTATLAQMRTIMAGVIRHLIKP